MSCVNTGESQEEEKMEKIEITMETYNVLLMRSMKYDILKKSITGSIRKYVSGNGLYLDSNLLDVFALLFPEDYEKRVAQLMKEGDPE